MSVCHMLSICTARLLSVCRPPVSSAIGRPFPETEARKRSRYLLHQLRLCPLSLSLSPLGRSVAVAVLPHPSAQLVLGSLSHSFRPCQVPAATPCPCPRRPTGGESFPLFRAPMCFPTFPSPQLRRILSLNFFYFSFDSFSCRFLYFLLKL